MRSGSCRDYETSTPCPGSARRPLALVSWSFPQRSSAVHPGFSRGGPSHPPANHSNGSDEAPWARDDGRSGARRPGSTRSAPSFDRAPGNPSTQNSPHHFEHQPPFSPLRSGPKVASRPSRQKQFPSRPIPGAPGEGHRRNGSRNTSFIRACCIFFVLAAWGGRFWRPISQGAV